MTVKGSLQVACVTCFSLGVAVSAQRSVAQSPVMPAQSNVASNPLMSLVTPPVLPPATSLPEAPSAVKSPEPGLGRATLAQEVEVNGGGDGQPTHPDDGISLHVESAVVAATAGAYSDIPRYLQTLPGVAFDSDARNTYLVNGGNAMENLYVIDGVEIPNINHIGTNGSSGGFVSVIDTDAVSSLTLHKQLYGSDYSGTLSSVLDIQTKTAEGGGRHGEVNLGYAGAGFVLEQPIGLIGTTMTQVRHSVVNYLTDDIGLDGVPDYHSVLNTSTFALGANDSIKTLFLASGDQLNIHTDLLDPQDPNVLDTNYSGSRNTGAITWHHGFTGGSNDLQINYSSAKSTTAQQNAYDSSPVYSDNLSETPITLRYDTYRETGRLRTQGGFTISRHSLDYQIDQAQGYPTPYSLDPTPVDASNIAVQASPMNAAVYGEGTVRATGRLELQGGLRFEHWGLNGSSAWMPRAGFKFNTTRRSFFFGGIGSYSQMPSLPVMLGVASNIGLSPIRNLQTQLGFSAIDRFNGHFQVSVYGRRYSDYPVSTEYTSVSLANMIDPFGQPFLYMPMVSKGHGKVLGFEAQYETDMKRRAFAQLNFTSRSVEHTALDGVWRRANFDMPVLANVLGGVHLSRRQVLTGRYSYHTGTPYTPFLLAESQAQNREIYDLSQINALRGGNYARLDLRYEVNLPLRHKNLKIYAGMENVLGRSNYYQYVMLTNYMGWGPYELTQMGRYAEGGMTWSF